MEEINLISKYKQNGNIKIEEIFMEYNSYIYKIIKNMAPYLSNEDIEEIILDVFLAIWNNKERVRDELPIKPYIAGITKNVVRNKCKAINITYNLDDYENIIEDSMNVQTLIEENERNELIKKALEEMKEIDRNIFILFYYNSMSINQIAEKLNISEVNTKTKLHRIRKQIKKFLIEGGY